MRAPTAEPVRRAKKHPWRPATRDPNNPYLHYATPTRGHAPPRCEVCRTRLKVKDVEVCSEECKAEAVKRATRMLARLLPDKQVVLRPKAATTKVAITRTQAERLRNAS